MSSARRCHLCNAAIVVALVKHGNDDESSWMPLDLKPSMRGQIAATKDVHGVIHGRILKGDEGTAPGEIRFITHFGTCPKYQPKTTARQVLPPGDPQPALFERR